jgi:hypothetical protein
MVIAISGRLTTVAAGSGQHVPAAPHFATRSRQVERSMQASLALPLQRQVLGVPLRQAVPLIENRARAL